MFNDAAVEVEAIAAPAEMVQPEIDHKSVNVVKFIASILFHVKFE